MYQEISIQALRVNLKQMVNHVGAPGRRLMILRNGVEVAGLVPPGELRNLAVADKTRQEQDDRKRAAKLQKFLRLKEELAMTRTDHR